MTKTITYLAVGMALSISGCAQEETVAEEQSALQLEEHSDTAISGSFDAGEMVVEFYAEMPDSYIGNVAVTVNGKTLAMNVDAWNGVIDFDADNATLTTDEVAAIASFDTAITAYLGEVADPNVMHESTLRAVAPFFAVAPTDMPLAKGTKRVTGLDKATMWGNGNDGKYCIKTGQWRTATFDQGSNGSVYTEGWTVGASGGSGYACMGKCGAGCGSNNYDWTLDCLDHDACSLHFGASGGGTDSNCGDEWWNASDDYTAWWKRCRS